MQADKEWFSSWFDTPFYHILYKHRDEQEAQRFIDNLSKVLDFQQDQHILDLACGKGRHSVYLHAKGFRVTGLDYSAQSIAFAKQFASARLDFICQDMRLPFGQQTYDVILNLFTSFGYFETVQENLQALQHVRSALKDDGRLVIDFLNAHKVLAHLVESEQKTIDNICFKIERYFRDGFIYKEIRFDFEGKPYHFTEQVRALTLEEFQQYFDQVGLVIEQKYGNFDLQPYDAASSDRLILVIKKGQTCISS